MESIDNVILNRRTIYKFLDKEVSNHIVQKALTAASNAPCHKHTHPWKFYSIGNKSRDLMIPKISKLAEMKAKKRKSDNIKESVDRAVKKIVSAPVLFAVTSKLNPNDPFREKEDFAATVCALHNMVLSFWANGVGSHWSTGSITRTDEVYRILNIDGQKEEIIGFIKAGYPKKIPSVAKPAVDEFTHYLE